MTESNIVSSSSIQKTFSTVKMVTHLKVDFEWIFEGPIQLESPKLTTSQLEAVHTALKNHLVVDQIFQHSIPYDLIRFRSVSRLWRQRSSPLIHKSECYQFAAWILLQDTEREPWTESDEEEEENSSSSQEADTAVDNNESEDNEQDNLDQDAQNSTQEKVATSVEPGLKTPDSQSSTQSTEKVRRVSASDFLYYNGKEEWELGRHTGNSNLTLINLDDLLTSTPHTLCTHLKLAFCCWNAEDRPPQEVDLSSLIIRSGGQFKSLELVGSVLHDYGASVVGLGKFLALQLRNVESISLNSVYYSWNDISDEETPSEPPVQHLALKKVDNRYSRNFSGKLKEFASNSVEFTYKGYDPPKKEVEEMEGDSKILTLGKWGKYDRVLPQQICLGEVYPHIQILDITQLNCREDENWSLYFRPPFPFLGELAGVKCVKMRGDNCTPLWMQRIKCMCPNFKILDVTEVWKNSRIFLQMVIENWGHLEGIKMRVSLKQLFYEDGRKCPESGLDPVLTGMDVEVCERLRVEFEEGAGRKLVEFERFRTNTSICCMTELKFLRIRLDGSEEEMRKALSINYPFTRVSEVYAFTLMPHLRVSVCVSLVKDPELRTAIIRKMPWNLNVVEFFGVPNYQNW